MAGDVAVRQVSELQSKGPEIVAEVKQHAVELRRYGDTVAFVISPEQHRKVTQLEEAAQRALWAFGIQRGMKSLEEGTWYVVAMVDALPESPSLPGVEDPLGVSAAVTVLGDGVVDTTVTIQDPAE